MPYKLKLSGVKTELNVKPIDNPDEREEDEDDLEEACGLAGEQILNVFKGLLFGEESPKYVSSDDVLLSAAADRVASDFGVSEEDEEKFNKIETKIAEFIRDHAGDYLW